MLVDTHAHLNFPEFANDLEEVIARAKAAGVEKIVCASSNVADSRLAVEIAGKYPEVVFAATGIHPQQTDPENADSLEEQVQKLTELARNKEVAAIGECGLDYSPAPPGEKDRTHEDQERLFRNQIELAKLLNLPLIIHTRKAFEDTIKILADYQGISGVFHCYYNGKNGIEKVQNLGFYFGLDGNLTYDPGLQKVASLIPLERIVLETDAPFLSPDPFRGTRNEPAYVKIAAEIMAKVKNVSFEEVARVTTENAKRLFSI